MSLNRQEANLPAGQGDDERPIKDEAQSSVTVLGNARIEKAVKEYKAAAEGLEEKLIGFFLKCERKNGAKLWTPPPPLNVKDGRTLLAESKDILQSVIEKMKPIFDPKEKTDLVHTVLTGLKKFIGWTVTPLQNFLSVASAAQSVCAY
jgi:hypothetical protein